MPTVVVVGTQWGDEGKGKVVDALAPSVAAVVRFQGGNNAGHTLVVGGRKTVLHLLPSGALHDHCLCIIGPGVVVDPAVLLAEVDQLSALGVDIERRLRIASSAHVILPWHPHVDRQREVAAGAHAIGTTHRGIGPAYEDKVARRGLRIGDLISPSRLAAKLTMAPIDGYDRAEVLERLAELGARLRPWVVDVPELLAELRRKGEGILFEGAQGTFLDVDHGTWPYVTSSNTVAGAACAGAGVGPTAIDQVIGIAKAYVTRVGGGPFPTECAPDVAEALRAAGGEFGATTGRPRRIGWFDVPLLRRSALLNGLSAIALSKLDVLSTRSEIPVAMSYDGGWPEDLAFARPVYRTFGGWTRDLSACRTRADLPHAARAYVDALQEAIGVPIAFVGVGPDRDHTIDLR